MPSTDFSPSVVDIVGSRLVNRKKSENLGGYRDSLPMGQGLPNAGTTQAVAPMSVCRQASTRCL